MLRSIDLDHFIEVGAFETMLAGRMPDLATAKQKALGLIPQTFSPGEQGALQNDINAASTTRGVVDAYLKTCGVKAAESCLR